MRGHDVVRVDREERAGVPVIRVPRCRTSDAEQGHARGRGKTVSSRAGASALATAYSFANSATGVISSKMPGGWTNAKSW